jgi:hypothetical protein
MHIESSHPALSNRLIRASIKLKNEVQDIIDLATDCAGSADPEPSRATMLAQGLVDEWNAAYAEYQQAQETRQ